MHDNPHNPPFQLAEYSCPLINPPSQRGLFENKLHNIRLAIARINPPLLMPGEEFSFWQKALAPTAENGYREGAMFINHQVRTSLGGGLCQLSGLIYNLALLSGCRIVERHNHSIDAYGEERYIPLGRDATVAYGRKNLRFRNPYDFPLWLQLNVDEQHAWGSVRAEKPLPHQIRIETQWLETIASPHRRKADPGLKIGQTLTQPGLTGKVVKAWRVFEQPGNSRKETLSHDRYVATPTYTLYGAKHLLWARRIFDRLIPHG
ncbi:MAG TPA: VanW family protein [Gallionellaceae bacterium]